jgi:hypothetical protein
VFNRTIEAIEQDFATIIAETDAGKDTFQAAIGLHNRCALLLETATEEESAILRRIVRDLDLGALHLGAPFDDMQPRTYTRRRVTGLSQVGPPA